MPLSYTIISLCVSSSSRLWQTGRSNDTVYIHSDAGSLCDSFLLPFVHFSSLTQPADRVDVFPVSWNFTTHCMWTAVHKLYGENELSGEAMYATDCELLTHSISWTQDCMLLLVVCRWTAAHHLLPDPLFSLFPHLFCIFSYICYHHLCCIIIFIWGSDYFPPIFFLWIWCKTQSHAGRYAIPLLHKGVLLSLIFIPFFLLPAWIVLCSICYSIRKFTHQLVQRKGEDSFHIHLSFSWFSIS